MLHYTWNNEQQQIKTLISFSFITKETKERDLEEYVSRGLIQMIEQDYVNFLTLCSTLQIKKNIKEYVLTIPFLGSGEQCACDNVSSLWVLHDSLVHTLICLQLIVHFLIHFPSLPSLARSHLLLSVLCKWKLKAKKVIIRRERFNKKKKMQKAETKKKEREKMVDNN